MPIKPLIETNPYLKDPAKRKTLLDKSVATSTAIEGVRVVFQETTVTSAGNGRLRVHDASESYGPRR
jgi:hypothetical protein